MQGRKKQPPAPFKGGNFHTQSQKSNKSKFRQKSEQKKEAAPQDSLFVCLITENFFN